MTKNIRTCERDGKDQSTGKANAAGKTKVTAGKENRVPVGQGREKTAVKKKSGLCPVADKCGGCSWINKPYVEQLKNKEKQLKELLAPFCKVEGVIPMEHPEHYPEQGTCGIRREPVSRCHLRHL